MKYLIYLCLLLSYNLYSNVIPFEANFELVKVGIDPDNSGGYIRGFEIVNDTIYVCGSENELNITKGGFHSYIMMSTDFGQTWEYIDSTFYNLDNIETLQRYNKQIISDNKLFYLTEHPEDDNYTLKKTTDYGVTWEENTLDDIDSEFCPGCYFEKYDDYFLLSRIMVYHKSFDDGKTWQSYQRNIPDSLKNLYRTLDSKVLNDSLEYLTLLEGYTGDSSRRKYLVVHNINQNKMISIQPNLDYFADQIFIRNQHEVYMMGVTSDIQSEGHPILVKTVDNGANYEIVFIDYETISLALRTNDFVNKHGIFAFAHGPYLYISDDKAKEFYRIVTPDTTLISYMDVDSKGDIYLVDYVGSLYYKFSNPFTSVQDNNPVREQSNEIMVYPNPATDEIEVNLIQSHFGKGGSELASRGISEIEIYNMLGEKVITQSIQPMTLTHSMNVGQLPTGMYIIKIGDRVTKFIKE